MKRDMDLVRDLMLKIEESQPSTSSFKLVESRPDLEKEVVLEHLRLMAGEDFISGVSSQPLSGLIYWQDLKLTWSGHDFADTLRDPKTWDTTKSLAKKAGGAGAKALLEIGKAVVKGELQKLGLPIP